MAEADSPSPLTDGSAADVAQASSLCTACGLCCMGAIHSAAVLDDDEVARATAIGLPVLDRPGRPGFALPCPKLAGTSCTIFGQRPRVCGRYMCQVLIDYRDGRLSFDEATEHVRCAQNLLASVQAVLPDRMTLGEANAMVRRPVTSGEGPAPGAQADELLELRLRVIALQLYLDKHFRRPKEGTVLEMKPL